MHGTARQNNNTTGQMCVANYGPVAGCNINVNNAAGKRGQASAMGNKGKAETTRTITLLVSGTEATSIIGIMGRTKQSIQALR